MVGVREPLAVHHEALALEGFRIQALQEGDGLAARLLLLLLLLLLLPPPSAAWPELEAPDPEVPVVVQDGGGLRPQLDEAPDPEVPVGVQGRSGRRWPQTSWPQTSGATSGASQ